jgi:hypothetical protein
LRITRQAAARNRSGFFSAQLNVALGLEQVNLVHHLEHQVRQFVHAVAAVGHDPAEVDIREVVVRAAFLGGDADLRRGGVVVELDPEALEQFLGLLAIQRARSAVTLVEREEVAIEVAGVHRVPAVQFRDRAQVHEPVHLQRLAEVARRVGGHMLAGARDGQQFGLASLVIACFGHGSGLLRVPSGKADHRIAGDQHRFEFLPLGDRLGITGHVQRRQRLVDVLLEPEQTLGIELAIQRGVARGALFHELGENACAVRFLPLVGKLAEDALAHGAAGPERDHLLAVDADVVLADAVGGHRPAVEDAQVFFAVAGQFGIGRHGAGFGPALADDQLVIPDVDRLMLVQVFQRLGAHHRQRVFADVLPVEVGDQLGPLDRDGDRRFQALGPQAPDTFIDG